ncbi:unnamed protein product, partial [Symbiodinium natans]
EEEERAEPTELPSRFSTSAPTTRQDGRENAEGQKAGSDLFRGNASEDGASSSLPVNVLTAIRNFSNADLSKTEQQRSARSENRSFLDDIKAHRFQLKVPDAVQAEPRTRASGDAFTRALSERLKKVYVATHGEESEESEEEADAEWE